MSIVVNCDCGKKFKAKDEMAGKKVRCPECKTVLRIPGRKDDSAVGAVAAQPKAARAGSTAQKPSIDEESVLLKYEAIQKRKQLDAEADAAFRAEQQKLIASYDQLAGKASPADIAKKKNKEELTETGVKKPNVATKAADAAGSFFSNAFVKYLIIVSVLGGLTYGSVLLVKTITSAVDENVTSVTPKAERINELYRLAREGIAAKDIMKAKKALDEVVRIDATREQHRTYQALRKDLETLSKGK